jgi:6-phosphogluconolactonase
VIKIFSDFTALSDAAARLISDRAFSAVKARGQFTLVLSGGGTPRLTYERLAHADFRDCIPWEKVHIFWGDERCVPSDDPRSNYRMSRQALLDHVPIPPDQIHPISGVLEPVQAAKNYEASLRMFFHGRQSQFDFVLLGLGENGHTASLFPASPVLAEKNRWVEEVYVAEQQMFRITLTPPLLNQAEAVVFLVSGAAKAAVLRDVLEGPLETSRLPAQLIRPTNGRLCWFVDREAARLVSQETSQSMSEI